MVKVKRVRTIDAVVVGYRPGKEAGTVGSLILGLYDERGTAARGRALIRPARGREARAGGAPGAVSRPAIAATATRAGGRARRTSSGSSCAPSWWSRSRFDHMSGGRIRHGTKILRWREDKAPARVPAGADAEPERPWRSAKRHAEQDWPMIFPFFSAIVDAGETYAYPEHLSLEQARDYWMAIPPGRTVVAVEDQTVLGTATMGPNRPGRGAHVATASFMVDPAHSGQGVGRALGAHVHRLGAAGRLSGHAVQRRGRDQHRRRAALAGARLPDPRPPCRRRFNHRVHGYVGLHVMYQRLSGRGRRAWHLGDRAGRPRLVQGHAQRRTRSPTRSAGA